MASAEPVAPRAGSAPTRIYLAARYSRREELLGYAAELEAVGHHVRARWLEGEHQWNGAALEVAKAYEDRGEIMPDAFRFAADDMEDVAAAELVIAFTETPRETLSEADVRGAIEAVCDRSMHAYEILPFDYAPLTDELNRLAANASRGGRHVEFGIALAAGKRLIVCGPQENVFHLLPQVEVCETWPDVLALLSTPPDGVSGGTGQVAGDWAARHRPTRVTP